MNKKLKLFLLSCSVLVISFFSTSPLIAATQEITSPSSATEAPNPDQSPNSVQVPFEDMSHPPSYEGAFFKMIITLIALLVLVFFTFWIFRRFTQGRLTGMSLARSIKVLERRPLSAKTMLYLIEVGKKRILISESQLEVRTLHTQQEETSLDQD